MKGETVRYETGKGTGTMAKRDIAGVAYIVQLHPTNKTGKDYFISVWADTTHGEDHGLPRNQPQLWDKCYDKILTTSVKADESVSVEVAKAVNKAVNEVVLELEENSSNEESVLAALEANAEVSEENL